MKNTCAFLLLVASTAASCGGGSSGRPAGDAGAGGGGPLTDGGSVTCGASVIGAGMMGWIDDGFGVCADVVVLSSANSNQGASLDIVAATPGALSMSISITAITAPGPQIAGSFQCGATDTVNVRLTYAGNGKSYTLQTCQVTVKGPDASGNISGTFSAVLLTPAGATKQITGGTFAGPVSMLGG